MVKVNIKTDGVNLNTNGCPCESRWMSTEVLIDVPTKSDICQ